MLSRNRLTGYVKGVGIIGIGTGSTVRHFIDYLADFKADIEGAVSSSEASSEHLRKVGIPVLDLNAVGTLEVYVDGADEINPLKQLIKGGGVALPAKKSSPPPASNLFASPMVPSLSMYWVHSRYPSKSSQWQEAMSHGN